MSETFLGIDVGTSAVKLILINDKREVISTASRAYHAVNLPGGAQEINPEIWYQSTLDAMRELFSKADPRDLRSIGVTGQMHTLVTIGENGKLLLPAIMWNDTRTKDIVDELRQLISSTEEGAYISTILSTGSPAINLYWIKKNKPDVLQRMRKFIIGPDYIVYRLTGTLGTDYCEASTSSLYNIRNHEWSEEIRNIIGLRKDQYPEVRGSAIPAGKISSKIISMFGFPSNVDVLTGTGDNVATALSTGCLLYGYPVYSLGTSGVFTVPASKLASQGKGKKILFSTDGIHFETLVQGVVQSNGESINWWVDKISDGTSVDKLTQQMKPEQYLHNDLIFYPHLRGDKTIYSDPKLQGAFFGLSSDTDKNEMFYAVLEGLSFACRQLSEEMGIRIENQKKLRVVGGGTNNPVWMQLLSDVLGVEIEQIPGTIGPGFGISIMAMRKYRYANLDNDLEPIPSGISYQPSVQRHNDFNTKYRRYLRCYQAIKEIYVE